MNTHARMEVETRVMEKGGGLMEGEGTSEMNDDGMIEHQQEHESEGDANAGDDVGTETDGENVTEPSASESEVLSDSMSLTPEDSDADDDLRSDVSDSQLFPGFELALARAHESKPSLDNTTMPASQRRLNLSTSTTTGRVPIKTVKLPDVTPPAATKTSTQRTNDPRPIRAALVARTLRDVRRARTSWEDAAVHLEDAMAELDHWEGQAQTLHEDVSVLYTALSPFLSHQAGDPRHHIGGHERVHAGGLAGQSEQRWSGDPEVH
ncbi:hypothetical protein M427DRAFT_382599 [Gonapodya prolifera JEL478]|uniref:Uncharacterized protein n=1 Tax=Gonapodya prolifera (strain JEL478) TaxID=1344416 RepID=A0A139A936_GONPJ|nr:hypothetical protein M427DRAFT_382599 [Gonapodya prolifera JEL478]|eukprot:KXS13310.1 hypothetical protein M427DRAFT_382599 [Gonapodya prolifera JEL478]